MRILYLCQFFVAPNQPGSSRAWMVARFFGNQGHEVNVIASKTDYMTGNNVKNDDTASAEAVSLPERVNLKRINTFFNGKSKLKRLMQYIVYCFVAIMSGLTTPKPDVVLATSPPIFVGLIGCWLAKLRGTRYAFEIRDPWPDALIYFGILKKSILTRFLYRLEMYIYKKADLLIALTPGIKKMIVKKGIPEDKIIVVTNGYDDGLFEKNGELIYPRQKNKGSETKVVYVGSMGKINETEYMMEVVTLLKDIPEIKFEFIGAGICKEDMIKKAKERKLTNISILPSVPKEKVPQILSTGDIAIVFTKPGLYSEIGLHNKIFDYLGAGLPVVSAGGGDLRDLIANAGAGFNVAPRDVVGFAEKIKILHYDKEMAWQMGQKGRQHILMFYSREKIMVSYEETLKKMLPLKVSGQNG